MIGTDEGVLSLTDADPIGQSGGVFFCREAKVAPSISGPSGKTAAILLVNHVFAGGGLMRCSKAVTMVLAVASFTASSAASSTLKKVGEINLPGPAGKRFDYLTIDDEDGYLLSAHLGAGLLYVIDLKTLRVVTAIPDVPGVEGVEYVPDLKKAYTSDWYENRVGVIDLQTMRVIKKIPVDAKPDGSAYAAPFHKLYVSNERGKSEAVIDVRTDESVKTIRFNSETGMPQFDPVVGKLYVNLQDQNLFAVIDPATDQVVGQYPVGRCHGNHGMALDAQHRRAFLVCEENNLMTVFDLDQRKPIAYLPTAEGGDVVKYDPGLRRIYVACYSGAISVFQQDDPMHYRKLEDFTVEPRVHSLEVDVKTHRVYVPQEQVGGKPAARMAVYEAVNGN